MRYNCGEMTSIQYDADFKSKEGTLVRVRQMLPTDAPLLVDIFEHMGPESRYKRFNQTLDSVVPNRIWQEALHIAQADPQLSRGLIAFVDEQGRPSFPVGAARYVQTAPGTAEVAISIRDDFQDMGIGTGLMRLLADDARDNGYKELKATIRNDNPAIWLVFNRLPYGVSRTAEGAFATVIIDLSKPRSMSAAAA